MKWSFKREKGPQWPNDDEGKPVPPAYLTRVHGGPLNMELTLNLLGAYGIPYVCQYPNNGAFGKIIMGHSPMGTDIFVPQTMLFEAQDLLHAEIIEDEDEYKDEEEIQ